jgi:ATP:cob(I)alamin adenosyltransferase
MPRITKVYTRTGDDGTTALGAGQRVAKDSARVEAVGTIDELNSQIGAAVAAGLQATLLEALATVQNDLFHLGSDLCVTEEDKASRPVPKIEATCRRLRTSYCRAAHAARRSSTSRARSAAARSASRSRSRGASRWAITWSFTSTGYRTRCS